MPTLLEEWQLVALAEGRCADPFALLGPHLLGEAVWVRVLLPGALRVEVVDSDGAVAGELVREHAVGIYAGATSLTGRDRAYRLLVTWTGGRREQLDDPYRFAPLLGEQDIWYLAEGTHRRPWTVMGAHPSRYEHVDGVRFAVWAPNADSACVIGDFNAWDTRRHPMRKRPQCGVWELFVPGVSGGARYKFALRGSGGTQLPDKSDPFAFHAQQRPETASIVAALPPPPQPLAGTAQCDPATPVTIYEVHAGSWRRDPNDAGRFLSWSELAPQLAEYAVAMGFTHVELLPVSEHPFDGSWGYQPTALYAPTSRHGSPADFAGFVDTLHAAGIGVILDWVPAHFPDDAHGLARFDGTCLYEHADPRQGRHPDWGTLIYNFGRREVRNFLVSNALYWLEVFGVDGLRVDAVASMLYLDYSRAHDEWVPNRFGGRENLEAVDFLREVNAAVREQHPNVLMIAEESTAWPGVTSDPGSGGLGFHYKWNMGWMNDTLEYISRDPIHRKYHHDELTFGFTYAHSERFVLPLSHDEVVHGKQPMLGKMPGDEWQRFAHLRAYYAFMYAHPGKKLLFMGLEFAQTREWNHDRSLDWRLLEEPRHAETQRLVRDLNHLYRELPALHTGDANASGFQWISGADADHAVIAFLRMTPGGEDLVVAVCHFTAVPRPGYRVGVPRPGRYAERMNSDAAVYGGSDVGNLGSVEAQPVPFHGFPCSLSLTLPPLATLLFEWQG